MICDTMKSLEANSGPTVAKWGLETLSRLYSEVRDTWCPTGKLFACAYTEKISH